MVVALLALFVALDGPATAARLIDGKSIKRNSITNQQIRNGTLGTQDLSKTAVKRLQTTPTGSVATRQLAARAVDASKIADGAVGTGALAPKAVDGTRLGDGAVGSVQVASDAVTSSKLSDGAVGAAAVADGGLQTKDLGDFQGSVMVKNWDRPFAANTCQVVVFAPEPSAPGMNAAIGDDVVSVSAGTGWPDPIVVTGTPGAGNTLRIVACRVGGNAADPSDVIDPGPTTFQYVAFDSP
ncbi:MAG TPA: hypothetical protein VK501_17600 [Baekduia sp.]|uniref:hypothetical protein n=1 Tax=Baekduia sp. TaxID=2600305 RepID=UPI002D0EE1A6|nr:hypothetical protein [Baekduia sp.]HMJ35725.1 hypothetical protein [Baekduia sp.]